LEEGGEGGKRDTSEGLVRNTRYIGGAFVEASTR